MKKMTNYQRVTQYLAKVFKLVNEEYFDNSLDTPTVTIQSRTATYGHVTTNKVWINDESAMYELNICSDYLSRPIEDIVATMIHEAVHLYAMQNNIKDTSNRGIYHNKRFKQLAEERGLHIERHEIYGWTLTSPTEAIIDFCIKYELTDIEICRQSDFTFGLIGIGTGGLNKPNDNIPKVPKKSSSRKYICPSCGNSFRATKDINVLCMDCNTPFELA